MAKATQNPKAKFTDQAITIFDRLPHGAFFRFRNRKTILQKLSSYGKAQDFFGKVYHVEKDQSVIQVTRKNPSMFGAEAVAAAKRVQRVRPVKESSTGERGHITGAGPNGWLKVKWANRDKATLIKRSELKLARGLRSLKNPIEVHRCTACGQVFGQTTKCPMCEAGIGTKRRNPKSTKKLSQTRVALYRKVQALQARAGKLFDAGKKDAAVKLIREASKLELRVMRSGDQLDGPVGKLPNGITEAAAGLQALEYIGGKVKAGGAPKYRRNAAKGSRDALGVWHVNPVRVSHQNKGAYDKLVKEFGEKAAAKAIEWYIAEHSSQFRRGVDAFRFLKDNEYLWRHYKKNPSVADLSEKFQGQADGSVEQLHAASGAPANLARAGKLVFLKVSGKTFRVPGAMVAIAPNERLWIVGDHAPLFETKARLGEGLDVGEVTHICYETAKSHIGEGKTFEYVHEFGEEGGKRPHLIIDHEGMPILRGGDYKIRAEGIVN